MPTCRICCKTLPPRHRKYCKVHSKSASRMWKREHRRVWREQWIAAGRTGDPPYLDDWKHGREGYRAYKSAYMQRWRAARRNCAIPQPSDSQTV